MIQFRNFYMMVLLTVLFWSPSIGQEAHGDPGDYQAGEKVFREMENTDGESCLDCHYFDETDTINWNPSAMALSGRVEIYKAKGLGEYFNAPAGVLMKKVHDGVSLTGDQEGELIAYLDHLNRNPYIQDDLIADQKRFKSLISTLHERLDQVIKRAQNNQQALGLADAGRKAVIKFEAELLDCRQLRQKARRQLERVTAKDNIHFDGLMRVSHVTDASDWRVEYPFVIIS